MESFENNMTWLKTFFDRCLQYENIPPLSAGTRAIYEKHNLCTFQDARWITKLHRTAATACEMTPIELLYTGYLRGIEENFFHFETKPYMNVQKIYLGNLTYRYRYQMGDRSSEFGFHIPDLAPHHFYEWFHIPKDYIRMHEFYNLFDVNAIDFLHHGYRLGIMDGRRNLITYPPEEINQTFTFVYPKNIASFLRQNCPGFAPAGYIFIEEEYPHMRNLEQNLIPSPPSPIASIGARSTQLNSDPSSDSGPSEDSSPNLNLSDFLPEVQEEGLEIVKTPEAFQQNCALKLGSPNDSRPAGPVLARFAGDAN